MRIALIADTFPPLRTSGAVQLRDLSREFVRQGHDITVILPTVMPKQSWLIEKIDGVTVLRLNAPRIKDINYFLRAVNEFLMPFSMRKNLRKSPLADVKWDGVVWYAPSIFHGPLANALKKSSQCRGYLIIRDIFPQWAVDMGLMGKGIPYHIFNAVARYQYSVADVIGVQSAGNLSYFSGVQQQAGKKIEVLQNWLDKPPSYPCKIRLSETSLAGRKLFVYAGNMGVAQGMDILIDLASLLTTKTDVGFVFVGRGRDSVRLKKSVCDRELSNVLFFDEIDPDEIPDLYAQCSVGIVALDPRHKSHNIPGKFLTYMQNGLPVLATVNRGNDLASMIRSEDVGQVCESNDAVDLMRLAETLLNQIETDKDLTARCRRLFERNFSVEKTVQQIERALTER